MIEGVLFDLGGVLAPMMAAALQAAVFTEAISYTRDWAGLTLRRQALGAQVAEQRIWSDPEWSRDENGVGRRGAPAAPLVLTMLPRVLSAVVLATMTPGKAGRSSTEASMGPWQDAYRVLERVPPDPQTVDVADADVVFTCGKGCDRNSFDVLCELAGLVGASVGVTRPVWDLGWAPFERMIGQTGRTVVPRLYFAWGISGAVHHLGGIADSKRIVCMNSDPKAPIFPNADEGFVTDVREVLPLLLGKVRALSAAKRGGAPLEEK